MADEPDSVPALPELIEGQIEPPEIVKRKVFTGQASRFNLREKFIFCCYGGDKEGSSVYQPPETNM